MKISKELSEANARVIKTKLDIGFHVNEIRLLLGKLLKQQSKFEQLKFKQSTKKRGE